MAEEVSPEGKQAPGSVPEKLKVEPPPPKMPQSSQMKVVKKLKLNELLQMLY